MKVCIIHVDDESDEPRQVSERIAADGLPHFFRRPILDARFVAENGGLSDVHITWTFDGTEYELHYYKCYDETRIPNLPVDLYEDIVFIFDVHKDNEYGTGRLLRESEKVARELVHNKEFKAVIWTNFPNSQAVVDSEIKVVKIKKNVGAFAIELMEMLGFTVHE